MSHRLKRWFQLKSLRSLNDSTLVGRRDLSLLRFGDLKNQITTTAQCQFFDKKLNNNKVKLPSNEAQAKIVFVSLTKN